MNARFRDLSELLVKVDVLQVATLFADDLRDELTRPPTGHSALPLRAHQNRTLKVLDGILEAYVEKDRESSRHSQVAHRENNSKSRVHLCT